MCKTYGHRFGETTTKSIIDLLSIIANVTVEAPSRPTQSPDGAFTRTLPSASGYSQLLFGTFAIMTVRDFHHYLKAQGGDLLVHTNSNIAALSLSSWATPQK